jgi:hypothetical protein
MCLECRSRVTITLQTMYGFSFSPTSPNFCLWWFSILFFKDLHIYLCDQRLGPFHVLIKLAWHCKSLNIIVEATFFLVAIPICFLTRHPLIRMNYNWLYLLCYGGHLPYSMWSISSMIDTFCWIWCAWVDVTWTSWWLWTTICVSIIICLGSVLPNTSLCSIQNSASWSRCWCT